MKTIDVHCSFCGKSQRDVYRIVAGPGVNICDECVDICSAICGEHRAKYPMVVDGAPEVTLCLRDSAGETKPITGIDLFIDGWGPVIRMHGPLKRADGDPGRLVVDQDSATVGRLIGYWVSAGMGLYRPKKARKARKVKP
jgi:hypothetical protein